MERSGIWSQRPGRHLLDPVTVVNASGATQLGTLKSVARIRERAHRGRDRAGQERGAVVVQKNEFSAKIIKKNALTGMVESWHDN